MTTTATTAAVLQVKVLLLLPFGVPLGANLIRATMYPLPYSEYSLVEFCPSPFSTG